MKQIQKTYSHWSGHLFEKDMAYPFRDGSYDIQDYWDGNKRTRTQFTDKDIADKKIILFAGDSFTFGDGVYYKDTFCSIIAEEYLNQEYFCINIAQRGSPNQRILVTIKQWLNDYGDQVDTVICGFSHPARKLFITDDPVPWKDHVYDNNKKNQHDCLLHYNPSTPRKKSHLGVKKYDAVTVLNNETQDIIDLERDILLLKGFGKIYHFKTYWWWWAGHYYHPAICDEIVKNTQDDDFDFIKINYSKIKRIPDDGHYSAEGHRQIAKIISEKMDLQ